MRIQWIRIQCALNPGPVWTGLYIVYERLPLSSLNELYIDHERLPFGALDYDYIAYERFPLLC